MAPDNYDQQRMLAELYRQANLLDSALEHMLLAEKALEFQLAAGGKNVPKDVKERELFLKTFRDKRIAPLDQEVRARLAKLKEKSDAKPLEQAAFAYRGTIE